MPVAEKGDQKELYSFRETMEPPPAEPDPKRQQEEEEPSDSHRQNSPAWSRCWRVQYSSLLSRSVCCSSPSRPFPTSIWEARGTIPQGSAAASSLAGRAAAPTSSSSIRIDPQQVASFAAVAQDPSRQLSVTIRIRDAAGLVACQKQILFPASVAHTPGTKFVAPREPRETQTGDIVQNMTGEDGQIAEIDLTGPLPCPAKAYSSFKSWEFFTNFPTLAEQDEWLRHERGLNAERPRRQWRISPQVAAPARPRLRATM